MCCRLAVVLQICTNTKVDVDLRCGIAWWCGALWHQAYIYVAFEISSPSISVWVSSTVNQYISIFCFCGRLVGLIHSCWFIRTYLRRCRVLSWVNVFTSGREDHIHIRQDWVPTLDLDWLVQCYMVNASSAHLTTRLSFVYTVCVRECVQMRHE